mgnify:CR=1 FL=1|tara:strand:+ start:294 stop:545 length:252 start_codon:yes stop_codon:yes gene_type:complete
MKVIVLSMNNDKEWHSANQEIFLDLFTAVAKWNKIMLTHKAELLQVNQAREELEENGFLLFTFTDKSDRKWGIELNEQQITTN